MNTKIRLRAIITIILSALLILSITGCGKGETKKEEKKPSKPSAAEHKSDKRQQAYKAYKTVIEKNRAAIKAYSWQTVPGKDTYNSRGIDRPISLCDINGDKIPELFFFTAKGEYEADMHIYTFNGNEAVELNYGGFSEPPYEGKLSDQHVAAGTSYVVFKGKDANTLYIYDSYGDDYLQYNIHRYVMKGSKPELTETLYNRVSHSDNGSITDVYRKNGKPVKGSEGGKAFTNTFAQLDKAIIFSTYRDESNVSVWKKFSFADALCISYDQAIAKLNE